MAVRTKQLFAGQQTSAGHNVYTVPSGHRTILKELVVCQLSGSHLAQLWINLATGNDPRLFVETLTQGVPVRREFWTVLEAGQHLRVQTAAPSFGTVVWALSGAELQLP